MVRHIQGSSKHLNILPYCKFFKDLLSFPFQLRTSAATSAGFVPFHFVGFFVLTKISDFVSASFNILSLCRQLRPAVSLGHSNVHFLQRYFRELRVRPGEKRSQRRRRDLKHSVWTTSQLLFSTNSWRISPSTSWCPFFSAICPETAATPSCCGRCC